MDSRDRVLKVQEFLDKYSNYLSIFETQLLINYAKNEIPLQTLVPDVVREIYDELELLPDENNIYKGFINLINSEFPLKNRKIIEIGGGIFPRLGFRIETMLDNGSITVYDPRLALYIEDTEKMKLVRCKADKNIPIGDADLIIGLMPCEAAEVIIDIATLNNIDFMVSLCEGGPHGDIFDYFEDEDEWRHYILSKTQKLIEEKKMGKMKIKSLEEYGSPYPVIYNDRNSK